MAGISKLAMELSYAVVETPIGSFTLGASESAIHEAFFGKPSVGVSLASHVEHPILSMASEQVEQYFAGKRISFSLPIAAQGTPFQRKAWEALHKIPYGKAITYSEQADLMGEPGKARAVGMANGRNPVCLLVPCHRVVGKDGNLRGYAFGLDIKKSLLDFEARLSKGTLLC
ncbi:uncharacterized protein [Physcomitrium patens]|uniref:Methylated-DNA--protein-cysteine methyltransferase n=1 Tax=Physcomitrium patens TaxID=3218 RepID=A0A2K1JDF5_PHYPA|nr:uncharacterized protein LOC112292472 [Physcomitrium patens]PNR39561.1 hypothetical protein PHYPA_019840 [Physcomitrium patens]|eukprot:XP_024396769.1 uncharacterized protein LOC112292472 [Physcomitrella patens]